MRTRFAVAAHLSAAELAGRYRTAADPVRRSQLQMVWLLVAGRSLAEVTGSSSTRAGCARWSRGRCNAAGPGGLGDRRHANRGGEPLLEAEGRSALARRLEAAPPDGGLWTSGKVAAWIAGGDGAPAPNGIAGRTEREAVAPQRGWDYLRRTGHSRKMPRPRHARAADAAAQAAFQKA